MDIHSRLENEKAYLLKIELANVGLSRLRHINPELTGGYSLIGHSVRVVNEWIHIVGYG
jgi:hypothetical protein